MTGVSAARTRPATGTKIAVCRVKEVILKDVVKKKESGGGRDGVRDALGRAWAAVGVRGKHARRRGTFAPATFPSPGRRGPCGVCVWLSGWLMGAWGDDITSPRRPSYSLPARLEHIAFR